MRSDAAHGFGVVGDCACPEWVVVKKASLEVRIDRFGEVPVNGFVAETACLGSKNERGGGSLNWEAPSVFASSDPQSFKGIQV